MTEHLRLLRSGRAIDRPTYDFSRHVRENRTVRLQPCPVVVVEGTLILENQELRELLDVKIFLDTDADVRFIRRLRRDLRERGRTVESIIEQYLATVYPMHKQFVEPSMSRADVILARDSEKDVEGVIQKVFASLPVTPGASAGPQSETRLNEGGRPAGHSGLPMNQVASIRIF
jgi:uridine kinase